MKPSQVSAVCTAAEGAARLAADIARSLNHAEGRRHAGSTRTSAQGQNFVAATADTPDKKAQQQSAAVLCNTGPCGAGAARPCAQPHSSTKSSGSPGMPGSCAASTIASTMPWYCAPPRAAPQRGRAIVGARALSDR